MTNKLAHGIVLAFFGMSCWFVWVCFEVPLMVPARLGLPGFTKLCVNVGPWIVVTLAVVAIAYCLWVWFRKGENRNSWVAFLATATSALLFVALPGLIAISLALIGAINSLPIK